LICDSTLKKQLNGISFFGPWIIELYSSGFFPPKKQHCNNSTECLLRDEIIKQSDNLDEFLFTPVLLKFLVEIFMWFSELYFQLPSIGS